MKSISIVCPECILPLVKDVKQLGKCKNWYVCTSCGYRERPANESVSSQIQGQTIDRIKFRNNQQNKHSNE